MARKTAKKTDDTTAKEPRKREADPYRAAALALAKARRDVADIQERIKRNTEQCRELTQKEAAALDAHAKAKAKLAEEDDPSDD